MGPGWLWIVLAVLAGLRLVELAQAARARRRLSAAGAKWIAEDGYALLVFVHVMLFVACGTEAALAPWAHEGWWTVPAAFLFAAGAGLRYWAMAALGWRWSTRVYTLPGAPLVRTGPYRFMRHPIYAGVFLELLAIPLLAGLWLSFAVVTAVHLVALRRRIAVEESALGLL